MLFFGLPPLSPAVARAMSRLALLIIYVSWWQLLGCPLCLQAPCSAPGRLRRTVWLEDLCAWLRLHKRRPYHFERRVGLTRAESEERVQYHRYAKVRRLRQRNELSQKQLDMLQPFWNEIMSCTSAAEARRTAWLENLCVWIQHHKRRPCRLQTKVGLKDAELDEKLQYWRCQQARRLHRTNKLSSKQLEMLQPFWSKFQLDASFAEIKRTACIQNMCSWIRLHKRKPRRFQTRARLNETEQEEKLQYAQWIKVRSLHRRDQLTQKQLDVLESVWHKMQPTAWLEELCAWLRLHKRRPSCFKEKVGLTETELEERLQYGRCAHVRRLLRRNGLSKEQLDMLEPHWHVVQPSTSTAEAKRTAWLEDLCAWLRLYKRRPRRFQAKVGLNETELEEQLQYKRCQQVGKLHRRGKLGQKHFDMLQPVWHEIEPLCPIARLTQTAWLEELIAWLQLRKRKPRHLEGRLDLNQSELEERTQYRRCSLVRRLLRRNDLNEGQLDMLQPYLTIIQPPTSFAEAKRTAWLEVLCAWLRLHRRRPYHFQRRVGLNESELEERMQYGRCWQVGRLRGKNQLNQEQLDMLQPFLHLIQPATSAAETKRTAWLKDLCAWLHLHKRRPYHFERAFGLNKTEREEYLQYRRCVKVRGLLRRNALSKEQLDMLQPFRSKIETREPNRAAGRRPRADWLEDLCDWLQFHRRRPRPFGTETEPWHHEFSNLDREPFNWLEICVFFH